MSERFKDFLVFAGGASVLTVTAMVVAGLWVLLTTSPDLPFCERWAPVADLPMPMLKPVLPKRAPEIRTRGEPNYFCARYVSTNQCRIA